MDSPIEPYRGLFGVIDYPGFLAQSFSSKFLFCAFVVHFIMERTVYAVFEEQLASRSQLASMCFRVVRAVLLVLVGIVWYFKPEEGKSQRFKHGLATWLSSSIVAIQSATVILIMLTYSAVVFYDVFVVNPQRIGLTKHAGLACFTLKFVTPLIFFMIKDTPVDAIFLSFGICCVTALVSALYASDMEQLLALFLYMFLCCVAFVDTVERNKKMCEIVEKLQHTLKENDRLAVEAQALELRAMIGNVAHDLKTPLTSFLSGIECISDILLEWREFFSIPEVVNGTFMWTREYTKKGMANNELMLSCIANMNSTNSFMTMTINRCLDYTKTTNGFKLVPKFETVSLKAALDMPVTLIRDAHTNITIRTSHITPDISSHIITDKQWLLENLLCLLSNAAKYSHRGAVDIGVTLCHGAAPELRFEVQDTGIGLSDEAMQGLFNPFKQAQRLAGGTGLGLFSLAKRVEALHGQYGVMRRPDGEQGSIFWFTIPYRPDAMSANLLRPRGAPSLSAPSVDPGDLMSPRADGGFQVLVVDDAPLIVKMTTMLLQRKGHRVQHAVNGVEALEKLMVRTGSFDAGKMSINVDCESPPIPAAPAPPQFDVVLMDLQMPVLDGIEAIRRLRAHENNSSYSKREKKRQFVIALSANSDEETRQEALAAGADAFMCKPFTYDGFSVVMFDHEHNKL